MSISNLLLLIKALAPLIITLVVIPLASSRFIVSFPAFWNRVPNGHVRGCLVPPIAAVTSEVSHVWSFPVCFPPHRAVYVSLWHVSSGDQTLSVQTRRVQRRADRSAAPVFALHRVISVSFLPSILSRRCLYLMSPLHAQFMFRNTYQALTSHFKSPLPLL